MDRQSDRAHGVDTLCAAIVERDHASLRKALPRIAGVLAEIAGAAPSPQLSSLRAMFDDLADQIRANLAKEENLLYPAIEALSAAERQRVRPAPLPFVTLLHPIRVMETDHVRIEEAVERLRDTMRATNGPCRRLHAWHQCSAQLSALDAELHEHHFIENAVLFPRALELERRVL
jgi:regulator of cell morphogenesis and NO signaling